MSRSRESRYSLRWGSARSEGGQPEVDTPLGGLFSPQYNVVPSSFSSIQTQCPFWSYIAFVHEENTYIGVVLPPLHHRTSVIFSGFRVQWALLPSGTMNRSGWIQIIPCSRLRIHTHTHAHIQIRTHEGSGRNERMEGQRSFGGRRRRRTQYLRPSVCPALRRIRRQSYSATLLLHDPCLLAHHNNVFIK